MKLNGSNPDKKTNLNINDLLNINSYNHGKRSNKSWVIQLGTKPLIPVLKKPRTYMHQVVSLGLNLTLKPKSRTYINIQISMWTSCENLQKETPRNLSKLEEQLCPEQLRTTKATRTAGLYEALAHSHDQGSKCCSAGGRRSSQSLTRRPPKDPQTKQDPPSARKKNSRPEFLKKRR